MQSNKMGSSSSANEIQQVQAKRQPTGDFIGTQLNDESDATSNPARGSSFMEKREVMASAESQGNIDEKANEEDNEAEDDEDDDEDYNDDDYEEDNYEDDDNDFESESPIEEKSDKLIESQKKEEESPEIKLAKDTSQVETRKVLQISGMLPQEDPMSGQKMGAGSTSMMMHNSSTSKTMTTV